MAHPADTGHPCAEAPLVHRAPRAKFCFMHPPRLGCPIDAGFLLGFVSPSLSALSLSASRPPLFEVSPSGLPLACVMPSAIPRTGRRGPAARGLLNLCLLLPRGQGLSPMLGSCAPRSPICSPCIFRGSPACVFDIDLIGVVTAIPLSSFPLAVARSSFVSSLFNSFAGS